jgi:membrane associated rhomboid family serine protease
MAGYDDGYSGQSQPQMQFALPPLTLWVKRLMIANATIFIALFIFGFASLDVQGQIVDFLGLNPGMWRDLIPALWQPFTYAFLHDLQGLSHLLFNMLGLFFFGTMLESMLGGRRFIVFYMSAAVAGALLHLVFMLATGGDRPTIGASGAVVGVVVAAATLRPQAQVFFFFIPVKLWALAAIMVAFDVFPLLVQLQQGGDSGRVAHTVHLGGAIFGFLAVRLRWIWKDPVAVIANKRAVAEAQKQISDDAKMDQLLAKIGRDGLGSLSKSEKAFLNKRSARKK